jgi:S1-C subfamily serine protease
MTKNFLNLIFLFLVGIFGGILGSQILWPYFVEKPLFSQYRLERNPVFIVEKKEIKTGEKDILPESVAKVEKSVLAIETGKGKKGSALILTSDGLVLTLADLADPKAKIFFEKEILPFQIIKKDLKENLALLKIEKKDLPSCGFADLTKKRLGERVFLVSGLFQEGTVKKMVDEGIIRSLDSESFETNIVKRPEISGSPLFDLEGNLLGIAVLKEEKVSFIPVPKIKSFSGF